MPKKEITRLLSGYKQFREKFFDGKNSPYTKLQGWQGPKTLIIGCSDSRVDPAILSSSGPGELFVVRNVANLVPPYDVDGGRHGVSAAIEFAVINLKVENVIVLGHRQCGGIRALLFPEDSQAGGFVQRWMKIAEPAKDRAVHLCGHSHAGAASGEAEQDKLWRQTEMESIATSMGNLRTFPFLQEAVQKRGLNLLGLYFDLENGELLELNEKDGSFAPVVVG